MGFSRSHVSTQVCNPHAYSTGSVHTRHDRARETLKVRPLGMPGQSSREALSQQSGLPGAQDRLSTVEAHRVSFRNPMLDSTALRAWSTTQNTPSPVLACA